ncbi:MAG TPA: hypothetical protein VGR11_07470, partial [Solirubrobacteraceae bacterium]|nr:hypothetical protein [Solirubrobacteraceae bacterium]
ALEVSAGANDSFRAGQVAGVEGFIGRGRVWGFNDDIDHFRSPWWTGELKVPLDALAPFALNKPLRMALSYTGSIARKAIPSLTPGKRLGIRPRPLTMPVTRGAWPSGFNPTSPQTWGIVETGGDPPRPRVSTDVGSDQERTRTFTRARVRAQAAGHQVPPQLWEYEAECPPINTPAWISEPDLKWPTVVLDEDEENPNRKAEGTLDTVSVSWEDTPDIHLSHDWDAKLVPTDASRNLVLEADPNHPLVLETETLGLPPNNIDGRQARPTPGDHVTAYGRWVFDCGHAPKTELHPIFAIESDRLVERRVRPGGNTALVRRARVWFNRVPGKYYHHRWTKPFTFKIDRPGELANTEMGLYARVVQGDPAKVSLEVKDDHVEVAVQGPKAEGGLVSPDVTDFFEIDIGYVEVPEGPAESYTVHLDSLHVNDDHDAGFLNEAGEWHMAAFLHGQWLQLFWEHDLEDDSDENKGTGYPINQSVNVVGNEPLDLSVTAWENDEATVPAPMWPDIPASQTLDSPSYSLGQVSKLADGKQRKLTSTPNGDWELYYRVTPGPEPAAEMVDTNFWNDALKQEPNDTTPTDLGTLATGPSWSNLTHPASIVEAGKTFEAGRFQLLERDVDRYKLAFDDFADVAFQLPGELKPLTAGDNVKKTFVSYQGYQLPDCLANALGYRRMTLDVTSQSGRIGFLPYDLSIRHRRKTLPGDWGEGLDGQGDTPADPCATEIPPKTYGNHRVLDLSSTQWGQLPYAWQHEGGDTDRYAVRFGSVAEVPKDHTPCEYDRDPSVTLRAPGMRIRAGSAQVGVLKDGNGEVTIDKLGLAPEKHVTAVVDHPHGKRDVYRLSANFDAGKYFSPIDCAAERLRRQRHNMRFGSRIPTAVPTPLDIHPQVNPADVVQSQIRPEGGFQSIRATGSMLDLIVSAEEGNEFDTRLYDMSGVLLDQSTAADEISAQAAALVPGGLVPQGRVAASGLKRGQLYVVHIIPKIGSAFERRLQLGDITTLRLGISTGG